MFIKTGNKEYTRLDRFEMAESAGDYIKLKGLSFATINERMKNIEKYGMVRIHKSYAVNVDFVVKFNSSEVTLENGKVLPLSPMYRDGLVRVCQTLE